MNLSRTPGRRQGRYCRRRHLPAESRTGSPGIRYPVGLLRRFGLNVLPGNFPSEAQKPLPRVTPELAFPDNDDAPACLPQ